MPRSTQLAPPAVDNHPLLRRFSTRQLTLSIGICASLIYLATLTRDFYWDGITFALQIETVAKGDPRPNLLFHQNHLLYNAVGYLLYRASNILHFNIRAITLLQFTNAFIGGAAVAVFFRTAERLTRSRYVAIVTSAVLALSAAWWKVSTDADAYILTTFFILIAAGNLLSDRPRWWVAGAAFAAAMLTHELSSLFFPAALLAIFFSQKIAKKLSFATKVTLLAWSVTITAYYFCAVVLHGLVRPVDVLKWATTNPTGKHLSISPFDGLRAFPKTNIDAIVGHNISFFLQKGTLVNKLIATFAAVAAVMCVATALRKLDRSKIRDTITQFPILFSGSRAVTPMLIVWILVYVLFLLFWDPLIYYRAAYTPALALGIGIALAGYHRVTGARTTGVAALAVATLGLFNLAFYIAPNMRSDANPLVFAAVQAGKIWDERTVIFFADRNEADTAFEYFNKGTRWRRLTRASVYGLSNEVSTTDSEGGGVWLNRGAIALIGENGLEGYSVLAEIVVEAPGASARYVQVRPR